MKHFLLILPFIINQLKLSAQETIYSRSTLQTGVGIGLNLSNGEEGFGTMLFLGAQLPIWKERLRINPHAFGGNFLPIIITDVSRKYYRLTTVGVNLNLDALKYKPLALFISLGGFTTYTRGLDGNDGRNYDNQKSPEYFFKLYFGFSTGFGLRLNPPKSRLVYEIIPLNMYIGTNGYGLGFAKFGIEIKLNKAKKQ